MSGDVSGRVRDPWPSWPFMSPLCTSPAPVATRILIEDPHAGVVGYSDDPELLRQCLASDQMSAAQAVQTFAKAEHAHG